MAIDRSSIQALCALYLRPIVGWNPDPLVDPNAAPVFDPPLSSAEQATYADLRAMARFGISTSLTLSEYQAIRGNLADLRPGSALENALTVERTRSDAQWNALTTAQTKTAMIAWMRDLTDAVADMRAVLAALMRDNGA